MVLPVGEDQLREWGKTVADEKAPLVKRFRALFGLRHAAEDLSVELIANAFRDSSALLKHELAYCLGQKGNIKAIPFLIDVLNDEKQEVIVRHEAAEALGAIGHMDCIEILKKYKDHQEAAISETCQLALQRIEWLNNKEEDAGDTEVFYSVDPAPAFKNGSVEEMRKMLLDEEKPLFERYRAMFTLRNIASKASDENLKSQAITAIADGLFCPKSALFRHEVAFVLGQLSHPAATNQMLRVLKDSNENPMVRHECAEALGSIATPECTEVLKKYLQDKERVVKESCVVALDIVDYSNSSELQYALTPHP